MTSIRLPEDIEIKLNEIAKVEQTTKSEIIKQALMLYINDYYNSLSPYELGKDLFGKYGSGRSDLSTQYKKLLRDRINAKHSY